MPRQIYPSSFVCDCGHQLDFCEGTIWEMQDLSLRKRSGIGEGSDRHAVIFDKGDWVAIFCPKIEAEIPAHAAARPSPKKAKSSKPRFTNRQGQVLAFIHTYTKLNRRPPVEAVIAAYFQITAPSAHGMVETLTKAKLIAREPGKARSIRLLIAADELPPLE